MKLFTASALVIALSTAGVARATTITLNETINLATPESPSTAPSFFGWRDFTTTGGAFSPTFTFELSAGDTLDFTANFLAGQSVTLTDASTLWLFSYETAGGSSNVNSTGTLALLDAAGNPLYTSNVKTDDEGSAHFGQDFNTTDFTALPSTVTFSGLRYVGTLNHYDDPTVSVRTYADPQVVFGGSDAIVTGGGVPEPATWGLMLVGFGGLGAVLRRRRGQAALTA
jgi:hypothetical protein